MVTINLGSFVDGKAVGIASNLDSNAVIEDLTQIRRQPITTIEDKIAENIDTIGEYSNLRTLISDLRSSVDFLRNPAGVQNQFANVFEYRSASLSSSTLVASSYLGVTASPGALNSITDFEIGNLAKALEQSTGAFNSSTTDATTTATGSYFAAGTFQVGSGVVSAVTGDTSDTFQLAASDYTVDGSATGILTAAGINNIVVTGASGGQTGLLGTGFSGFSGSYDSDTGELTVTVDIGGVTYTSNAITADTSINAGANTGIDFSADGVITFTADSAGVNETSFDIELNQDIIIDADDTNITSFLSDVESALSAQTIFQSREISNYVDANVKSPIVGLTNSEVRFYSDSYDVTTGQFGNIEGFNTEFSTGSDGNISVVIDGETFLATGLGTSLTTKLTLNSTSSDKRLEIDLANANGGGGVTVDFSTATAAADFERALDYAFGTRTLTDIQVESGDSLTEVAFKINQQSISTGLSASIIKIDEFDFRLSLKANNEGIDNEYEIFDTANVFANASLSTDQSAEDSLIRIDGTEISRSSNAISDAIENVTLNLLQVTPNYNEVTPDSVSLTIENDVDSVVTAVVGLIDNYNTLKVYDAEQNERDAATSEFTEDAVLGGDTLLRTLLDSIVGELTSIVSNVSDTAFDSISDIGIDVQDFDGTADTIATSNILTYDENELREALASNYDKVKEIFQFQANFNSSNITIFKTSNAITLSDFQLDINLNRGAGQEVQLLDSNGVAIQDGSGQDVYLTYSSGKITGPSGTDLDGLEFVYSGDGTEVITVSLTQGVADRIFNIADSYVEDGGVLDEAVATLTDQNDDYESDKLNLEARLETFRESLVLQFTALEAAVASLNNILAFIEADTEARNNF